MRVALIAITAAGAALTLGLLPTAAAADPIVLTGGTTVCSSGEPGWGGATYPATDGSCITVFYNQAALSTLDTYEKIQTAVNSCPNLPNGPYRRTPGPGEATDQPLDYFVLEVSLSANPDDTFDATDVMAQLADVDISRDITDAGSPTLGIEVTGTFNSNSAVVTVKQRGKAVESQALDLPGIDFLIFEKSAGGGQSGTLACDIDMWFRTADGDEYGVKSLTLPHGVNKVIAGFAAGPTGYGSQDTVETVCAAANPGSAEKPVAYLLGSYHVTPGDPENPINITSCVSKAHYCDGTEPSPEAGQGIQLNSCNPGGESGGIPQAIVSNVNGANSFGTVTCTTCSTAVSFSFTAP